MADAIAWFEELGKTDTASVGGKGANLGELASAGLPVPPGFVITAEGYLAAMDDGGVRDELCVAFEKACRRSEDPSALAESAERMQSLVHKAGVLPGLRDEVLHPYHRLGEAVPVVVRSSATAEDTAGTSFAGMHETFANVIGDAAVLERVVDCWASLFGELVAVRPGAFQQARVRRAPGAARDRLHLCQPPSGCRGRGRRGSAVTHAALG